MNKLALLVFLTFASFSTVSGVYDITKSDINSFVSPRSDDGLIWNDISVMDVIFCKYCGSPNAPIRRTCNKCGKDLHK